MEMKQMVYVVIENGYVTGVWNEYQDAENHVGEDGVIIPAVVDAYRERAGCETPSEVIEAMEQELQNLSHPYCDCEDEDEDEDDSYDEEEEEEEEEEDEDELTDNDFARELLDFLFG